MFSFVTVSFKQYKSKKLARDFNSAACYTASTGFDSDLGRTANSARRRTQSQRLSTKAAGHPEPRPHSAQTQRLMDFQ